MGAINLPSGHYVTYGGNTTGGSWITANTTTTNVYTLSQPIADPPAAKSELDLLDDRVQRVCREGRKTLG